MACGPIGYETDESVEDYINDVDIPDPEPISEDEADSLEGPDSLDEPDPARRVENVFGFLEGQGITNPETGVLLVSAGHGIKDAVLDGVAGLGLRGAPGLENLSDRRIAGIVVALTALALGVSPLAFADLESSV